ANHFRKNKELKEFHRIVGTILRLRKASLSVHEIEDPADPSQIIYEPNELRKILSEKYRTLFLSDTQRAHFSVGEINPTTSKEVAEAASTINLNKGLGMDCLPGSILQAPCLIIRAKLTEIINHIFKLEEVPFPFSCARLHLINKLKTS